MCHKKSLSIVCHKYVMEKVHLWSQNSQKWWFVKTKQKKVKNASKIQNTLYFPPIMSKTAKNDIPLVSCIKHPCSCQNDHEIHLFPSWRRNHCCIDVIYKPAKIPAKRYLSLFMNILWTPSISLYSSINWAQNNI